MWYKGGKDMKNSDLSYIYTIAVMARNGKLDRNKALDLIIQKIAPYQYPLKPHGRLS